jgi:hypothetical protein
LYRVIEKNSQEKKALRVEGFGDVFVGSRRREMAFLPVSFVPLDSEIDGPASNPHEYWRFFYYDFALMERRATSRFLRKRQSAFPKEC